MITAELPACLDDLLCVAECPELRPALAAGDFVPDCHERHHCEGATWGEVETVARHQLPATSECYFYRVQPLTLSDGNRRWHACGEYSWDGRTVDDADYVFLDGGGSFSSRAAALHAIRVYLHHLRRGAGRRS